MDTYQNMKTLSFNLFRDNLKRFNFCFIIIYSFYIDRDLKNKRKTIKMHKKTMFRFVAAEY